MEQPDVCFFLTLPPLAAATFHTSFISVATDVVPCEIGRQTMTTITVTTLNDVVDAGDGQTSLREAIAEAGANAGADTIVFDAALAGTITLDHALGALVINSDVTIDGDNTGDNKADITIDADRDAAGMPQADFHRVITIESGTVTLDSLTITGGRELTGGGISIASGATVTIDHSTITGNYVSGYESNSAVRGAGISNAGTLTITNSAIYDNAAGAGTGKNATGGGIYNTGTLSVSNTTIATNYTDGGDSELGVPAGSAQGAGIANVGGTVTLDSVTVTGNVATANKVENLPFPGAPPGSGTLSLFSGVYSSSGTVTMSNSIVMGNVAETATGSSRASDTSATGITYSGLNIIGIGSDTDASDHVIQASMAGLVFETAVNGGQSVLVAGLLADNGGPVKTVALNDDRYNPAIDAASGLSPTANDARGESAHDDPNIANAGGSARDLGAYELSTDAPANTAPVISGDLASSGNEGATIYITRNDLYFTDPDVLDDELNVTFTVSNQANGVVKVNGTAATSFTAYQVRTGQVSFTHNGGETTTAGFDVTIEDGNEDGSTPVKSRFNFTIGAVNDKPTVNKLIADVTLPIHTDWSFAVANNFRDPDSKLSFTAKQGDGSVLPTWIKLSTTGAFTLTPPDTASGTFTIVVTAKDAGGKFVTDTFNIIVPKKPVLSAGADNSADTITTGGASNVINAGNGTNTVASGGGSDTVYGGSGVDTVKLGSGNDFSSLGGGNDKADGEGGNDRIHGEAGNDTLLGGDGTDYVFGGSGNDRLWGDAGDDSLYGGEDADELHGGTENDFLYGDDGTGTLWGDAGDDRLYGGKDADELHGGTGNDFLYGGDGTGTLWGDAGDDRLYGGEDADELHGGTENDFLYGDDGTDKLWGDAGNDSLFGGYGDDELHGGIGNDGVVGDEGNDTLWGNAGADTIHGGWGADKLSGGAGSDRLTGGNGADQFIFGSDFGIDTITDFTAGTDKIVMSASLAGATLAALGAAQSATDTLIYDAATGALYLDADADGTGAAVQFATLSNRAAITISDFLFE
jgi:Ca2+-binding RTX toxin-like protein